MEHRAYEIANAFDEATDQLVETIRGMTDEQWNARATEDSWTVAQEALHLGVWMEVEGDWYARLAYDRPTLPLSREAADALNDQLIAGNPSPSTEQVLLEIAGNRTLVRHMLLGLSDERLDVKIPTSRAFVSGSDQVEITLSALAERMLVGHVESHLETIRETIS